MKEKLRVVLAGCGGMSETWVDIAKTIGNIEIVGLVDIREDAAKHRADNAGLSQVMVGSDLETVLTETSAEVLFDCTPPEIHFPNAMLALKKGCHVLSEKPMADSMDHARQMVEMAAKAKRKYAVIQNSRYKPGPRRLSQLFRSGQIGNVTTVNADFYIGAHFGGFRDTMTHVLLLDMAIHTFDTARFMIQANPISVYCKEWNPSGSWYRHGASAMAIFEFDNGVVFNYRGSWCAEGLNTNRWRFVAEQGSATWDGSDGFEAERGIPNSGFISEQESIDVALFEQGDKTDGHGSIIREFIASIHDQTVPETAGTDNINSLAMVFGAIESAETGKAVQIRV